MEDTINDKENKIEKKSENIEQNIINETEKESKYEKENSITEKDNLNNIWKGNPKYKIKYNHLIEFIKSKNKKDSSSYNQNQFLCNILLIPSNIEISNKVAILNLLSLYNKNSDLLYNIANKLDKCFDSINAIDPIFLIEMYMKIMEYLNNTKLYFYSYKYMLIIKKIIKKNEVLINKKYDISPVYQVFNETDIYYNNYIMNSKLKFSTELSIKDEIISEFKNLIDSLISEKYNLDDNIDSTKDNNEYIYIISKDWIFKTKFFIENYIISKEQKLKNFFEESFDPVYVYESYFNEIKEAKKDNDENNKKSSKLFYPFPGPVNNFEITSFKDIWVDFVNLDENDFLKKGMNYKEHYFYVNQKDWKLIKSLFDVTNEIKRKKK